MNVLTLKYDGTEKTVQAWGFTMPQSLTRSRSPSEWNFTNAGGDPAAAAIIPFEGMVEIYMDRTGSGTSWSGGTRIFVGYRTDLNGSAMGEGRNVTYKFQNAWYFLAKTTYQQQWAKRNSGDVSVTTAFYARILLWYNYSTGGILTTDEQLTDIINFANTQCGIAVQIGDTDPILNFPVQPVTCMMCADAINLCLRSIPDCSVDFDYSTNDGDGNPLPTVNFIQRANCTPITLPYAQSDTDGTRYHKSTKIKRRDDLQVPSVILQYQISNPDGSVTYTGIEPDTYGADDTGFGSGDLVAAVDLRGFKETFLTGQVTSAAIDPTTTGFWTDHKPDLDDDSISDLSVISDSVTVVDAHTGDTVSLTDFPNEVIGNGNFAPWMKADSTQIAVKEVKILAQLAYNKNSGSSGPALTKITTHNVSISLRLTNSATGTVNYKTIQSIDPGETQPVDLAYGIWCSCNNVAPVITDGVYVPPGDVPSITGAANYQYEGEHEMVENNISAIITPANTLNLTADPVTEDDPWTEMNAQIYEVEVDWFHGKTTVRFGPHKHLSAAEFFQMVMMWRVRLVYDNPNIARTGTDTGAGGQSIATDAQKQDTNHEVAPIRSVDTVQVPASSNFTIVQHDAGTNGGQIYLATVTTSNVKASGTVDIRIAIDDVPSGSVQMSPPDGLPIMCAREMCCNLPDGTPGTAFFICTYPLAS